MTGPAAWSVVEDHDRSQLFDIRHAHVQGKGKKADFFQRRYLGSYDAKLVAVRAAHRKMKPWRRPPEESLPSVAAKLCPFRGTDERVTVRWKEKANGSLRLTMDFGLENRALQYQVLASVAARTDLHPNQFAIVRGRHAAVTKVRDGLDAGFGYVVESDIRNCFPSFDEEKLSGLLPAPKEVIERVIASRHLNLYPGNLYLPLGLDVTPDHDEAMGGHLAAARSGVPPGSATSTLVAEVLLAPVLAQLPDCGIALTYADNFLLMGKTKADVVSMNKTLQSALKAHPAGPLQPNTPKNYSPGDPIEFLGYRLEVDGGVEITPSERNRAEFDDQFDFHLKRVQAGGISDKKRTSRAARLRTYVNSWCASFSLWKEAEDCRKEHLLILDSIEQEKTQ